MGLQAKPLWQRHFDSREEYEYERTLFMIELTKRAISPANLQSEQYLRDQLVRLEETAAAWKAKIPRKVTKSKKLDKKKKRK